MTRLRCLLALMLSAITTPAWARDVTFPIQLDHAFLRQLLVQQIYTAKGQTSVVWRDEQGCTELVLSQPEVKGSSGALRIVTRFDGKLGAGVGQWCVGVTPRSGFIELNVQPKLHAGAPVVDFKVVDSHLFGPDHKKELAGTLWDWVKGRIHPHIEAFRVDLRQPIAELKVILPMFLPQEDVAQTQKLLESIALVNVDVPDSGLAVTVQLQLEEVAKPTGLPTPEPTLTVEEVQRWEAAWHSWDAFLTFVIKRAGRDALSQDVADSLRAVLLEARYDLLPALRPASPGQPDPVPALFLRTWQRLAPVLRQLGAGVPGEAAVRYLTFVAATDALAALEQLGPEFGFEISANGLRRLARTIDPGAAEDPTAYSEDVDPELRKMFGFGAPLPVPEIPTPLPDEDVGDSEPAPGAEGEATAEPAPTAAATAETPAEAATATPPAVPSATPATLPDEFVDPPPRPAAPESHWYPRGLPGSWQSAAAWSLQGMWNWLSALSLSPERAAWAALDPADQDFKRLYRWAPKRGDLDEYLPLVRRVLVGARNQTRDKVPAEFVRVFDNLVFATAWQETCWRQFVQVGKKIDTIASPVGAVGIMQVNSKVWRGFYNVDALRADIAYNAAAGSEIVRHYFVDYAIKKGEHKVTGNVDNLARATYSAYNAGPGGLARYRQASGQKKGSIDAKFWDKYQQVKAGNEMSVASCYGPQAQG